MRLPSVRLRRGCRRGRRGSGLLAWSLLALVAFALRPPPIDASVQNPLILETHRIRVTNQVNGKIEVSLDGGRSWETIGRVSRPASVTGVGTRALEAAVPATVSGSGPESVSVRVPTTLATPRWLRIAAAGEAPNNAACQSDIAAGESIFRPLAPPPGSQVFLEKEGRREPLPTNYLPRPGDQVVIVCERSPEAPGAVVLENREGGQVAMVTPLGEEKLIGRVRQPLRGIGRYAGTERAGQGALVSYQSTTVVVSTAGRMRRLDAHDRPLDERGGFVLQPAESELKGATHPESQILIEAVAAEGKAKPAASALFSLPVPLTTGVPIDPAPSRVEVRIDGGEWEPMPDLRGGIGAAEMLARLSAALGKDRTIKEGITHLRIVPGASPLAVYRHFVRLAVAPRAANGVQRGRVTITANAAGAGIVFVSFYLDGTLTKVTNQPPFVWDWDTSRAANGLHLIEIRGADEKGTVVNSVLTKVLVDN